MKREVVSMRKTNKEYLECFYKKKAVELKVGSPREAKKIYEGLKQFTRLVDKYGMKQVQQWMSLPHSEVFNFLGVKK